jgi:sugar lactone lactonase YvrE
MGASAPEIWPELAGDQFAAAKLVSDRFELAESSLWDHGRQQFLFVDVNERAIHNYAIGGDIGVHVSDTNYVNGIIFDPTSGDLLMAETGGGRGGRITRMRRGQSIERDQVHGRS